MLFCRYLKKTNPQKLTYFRETSLIDNPYSLRKIYLKNSKPRKAIHFFLLNKRKFSYAN